MPRSTANCKHPSRTASKKNRSSEKTPSNPIRPQTRSVVVAGLPAFLRNVANYHHHPIVEYLRVFREGQEKRGLPQLKICNSNGTSSTGRRGKSGRLRLSRPCKAAHCSAQRALLVAVTARDESISRCSIQNTEHKGRLNMVKPKWEVLSLMHSLWVVSAPFNLSNNTIHFLTSRLPIKFIHGVHPAFWND